MRGQRRSTVAVTIAVAVGAAGLAACGAGPARTLEDDATLARKVTSVRLDTSSGSVELRGAEDSREVSVHRAVEYRGDRPEKATYRVEDGVLVLGGCGRRCSVDYTVELPAGLPVTGGTSAGRIDLSQVGDVRVTTDNGRIDLDGVTGTVDVRTTNGRITGRHLTGGGIRAETSNGAIDLTPGTPQDVRARTSNGAVTLTVPAGRYAVSARTSNGDKPIGVAGAEPGASGAHRLDLVTSNGDITVRSA